MVIYFWSRPDYGSNGNPIVIYFPHSECGFKQALDCIMLAFHHKEISGMIHKIMTARKHHTFDDIFDRTSPGHVPKIFSSPEDMDSVDDLFDIIRDGKKARKDNQHVHVAELINWAKDYAENILDQFRNIYHFLYLIYLVLKIGDLC